ncbi:hypothetical protein HHL22_12425 [Hymenobacter sp. RP-2-7]|uniref:Uncharacterized protein n=1 Tax=Hymenobacter polaris TaxID=2682546 RepID=A0A7Y0AES2_9BACT|nr:hypothetical protein [Hymenobacter polaris]NML66010.1 hypothetical protein [Hymenobacter polaris]
MAGLLLASCRKPDLLLCGPTQTTTAPPTTTSPTPTTPTSSISLNAFFSKYGAAMQRRGFVIGQGQPIRTAGGAALSVAGVNFVSSTNAVAQDSAYLYLREVYTVPQMVLSDLPTMSQAGQLLVSGGEFYMQVRAASGQRLRALPTASSPAQPVWQSPVPPEQDTTPQQYWQKPAAEADWTLLPNVFVQTVAQPTLVAGPAYQTTMLLDTLLYRNIDQVWRFYQGSATLGTVAVTTPTTAANETRVLLRPVGFNGLFRMRANSASGTNLLWTAALPLGATLKAVVLQSVNGQLYVGSQLFTMQSAVALTPPLTAVSEAEALAFIQAL